MYALTPPRTTPAVPTVEAATSLPEPSPDPRQHPAVLAVLEAFEGQIVAVHLQGRAALVAEAQQIEAHLAALDSRSLGHLDERRFPEDSPERAQLRQNRLQRRTLREEA